MDAQLGCGLSCVVLSLLSETSPLIGRHSAVQPKGMSLGILFRHPPKRNRFKGFGTQIPVIWLMFLDLDSQHDYVPKIPVANSGRGVRGDARKLSLVSTVHS